MLRKPFWGHEYAMKHQARFTKGVAQLVPKRRPPQALFCPAPQIAQGARPLPKRLLLHQIVLLLAGLHDKLV
jgi:hypothetical protein